MPEYYDYEEPVHQRTSARRYQPTQRPPATEEYDDYDYYDEPITQRPQRQRRTTDAHPQLTRSSVPARSTAGQPRTQQYRQPVEQPVQRQRVYSPPPIQSKPTRTIQQPLPATEDLSRRAFLGAIGKTIGYGTAAMVAITAGLSVGQAKLNQFNHLIEEGKDDHTTLSLACGHSDSADHPTELQAYINPNGVVSVEERPGGGKRVSIIDACSVHTGANHDFSNIDLQLLPEKVGRKYRIHLKVTVLPFSTLYAPDVQDFYLVDNGKGLFELAK